MTLVMGFPVGTDLRHRICRTLFVVGALVFFAVPATLAAKPSDLKSNDPDASKPKQVSSLAAEIDRLLAADTLAPAVPPADDAEFLRRATLDLHGIIPTAAEARAFFEDTSPDKRQQLVDRLLASPRFARHMATTFDVLWLERRTDKNISFGTWYDFLYQSFLKNKPYDQLVREVLAAEEKEELRGATKFYHVRTCEPDNVTRDIARLFFGMDMQCNQCHDHPVIDDYKITDYYGLRAFVVRTYIYQDKKSKQQVIAERADGETSFVSVFTGEKADKVPPRLPRGASLPPEPKFKKGEELVAKPAKDERPIPKFSRRSLLAEQAASESYVLVDRNAVNRLWAHVFGRGLVHPVDFVHPDNPPAHPEVLDLIARDFRTHGCDIRHTLRQLMSTKTYARSCELPAPKSLNANTTSKRQSKWNSDVTELEKKLAAAELSASVAQASLIELLATAKDAKPATPEQMAIATTTRDTTIDEVRHWKTLVNAKKKSLEEAQLATDYLRLAKSDPKQAEATWDLLVQFWSDRADVGLLKPLAPESFTDSLMQAAGVVATAEAKARDAIKKAPPKEMKVANAEERSTVEAVLIDKRTFEPLRTNFTRFVELYAEAPGQDFAATLNQALFFGNAGIVDNWLRPEGENLTARLVALEDTNKLAEEMYLSIFTRRPTDVERSDVAAYLKERTKDRAVAVQELAWALMSSSEFRFNH